jgi:hypothetical protein
MKKGAYHNLWSPFFAGADVIKGKGKFNSVFLQEQVK